MERSHESDVAEALMAAIALDDKYQLGRGIALMSGTQALVRLPMLQRQRDRTAGLHTAGFISGYRGSPIGNYDRELWRAAELLRANDIVFRPGLNEDLAATAVWGSQQVGLFPGECDGVFALWYGKGPGVDRSMDPLRHGNFSGAARHGGVLVVAADDPSARSSTIVQQSESVLAAASIPVLYPASVEEILQYGLAGWALSRYSGVWVGLKCVNETLETDVTVDLAAAVDFLLPTPQNLPLEGVHYRGKWGPALDERILVRHRLPLVQEFARSNRLDRAIFETPHARFGIVSAGKSYADVIYALKLLGIDAQRAHQLRLDVYKLGMIWPIEQVGLRAFAVGLEELVVVEEKRPFIEPQVATALYSCAHRPRLLGKQVSDSPPLFPIDGTVSPTAVALAIGARLDACGLADALLKARLEEVRQRAADSSAQIATLVSAPLPMSSGEVRTPYFCSGCPHNTSTHVPEGSAALGGIGCHGMVALVMDRNTLPSTQMGGEGANWLGIMPFVKTKHIFQNLGDGTYFHSGLLAIRAAVAANANITYKILYNGVVAMTGGQPFDGALSVADVARQVLAEGVVQCVVVSVASETHRQSSQLPAGVEVHAREDLDEVQRALREVSGVTVLIYEQMCATEKRRLIKRKKLPEATRRVFINEEVCEGCGDCSVASNCVSVLPKETPLGRKRAIDQSSCNEDLSCVKGFCPSFVVVRNARPRRRTAITASASRRVFPEPHRETANSLPYQVLVTGVGGTGVITVGVILAMAARLEGKGASTYNMTGMAQKNGPVYSYLRFSETHGAEQSYQIDSADADLVIACDVVAALAPEALQTIRSFHTSAVINSGVEPTAAFQQFRDSPLPGMEQCERLAAMIGRERASAVDATGIARRVLGDKIAANMLMVGFAYQKGLLPVGIESIERAIELNGVAVELNKQALDLGRDAALGYADIQRGATVESVPAASLDMLVELGRDHLTGYQNAAYSQRFVSRIRAVAEAEQHCVPGGDALAVAVAKSYRRLLAYKDEYEVARLYARPAFRAALNEAFECGGRVSVLLAPPLLSGSLDPNGNPNKREFGSWILPLFGLLARMKGLRGTALDLFGYTGERKMERALIMQYEAWLDEIVAGLTPQRHALAVRIAALPEQIRGYGHVKLRSVNVARESAARLLAEFRELRPGE
jgi:indolepyruvate ferredoxin oxidoreductase